MMCDENIRSVTRGFIVGFEKASAELCAKTGCRKILQKSVPEYKSWSKRLCSCSPNTSYQTTAAFSAWRELQKPAHNRTHLQKSLKADEEEKCVENLLLPISACINFHSVITDLKRKSNYGYPTRCGKKYKHVYRPQWKYYKTRASAFERKHFNMQEAAYRITAIPECNQISALTELQSQLSGGVKLR